MELGKGGGGVLQKFSQSFTLFSCNREKVRFLLTGKRWFLLLLFFLNRKICLFSLNREKVYFIFSRLEKRFIFS